jgi:chorismate-pyruvate lyase
LEWTSLKSKGFIPELFFDKHSPQLADLPAILRVLVVQDGTVTKTLEAYFWEPMQVIPQAQQEITWESSDPDLPFPLGSQLLQRNVEISGQDSGEIFCRASSLILLSALPHGVAEGLIAQDIGIGEILRDRELETYRELMSIYWLQDAPDTLARSYLIHINQAPVIFIREYFPLSAYTD